MEKFLTGYKDSDLIILSKLDDRDLLNICLANKYANRLCNNEDFWRARLIKNYGPESMRYKSKKEVGRIISL